MKRDLQHFLIDSSYTVGQAMARIDTYGYRVAYLVNEASQPLAAVTDGDIRRAILRGVKSDAPATEAAHPSPISLPADASAQTIRDTLLEKNVMSVPLVDGTGAVVDVVLLTDLLPLKKAAHPVVIMAGGRGARLGALTRYVPKPMLKVAGLPILHHILNNVKAFGYREIYLSVNYRAEVIEDYFQDGAAFGLVIKYVREPKPLGTGGSLRLCADRLQNDFFVINGDVLTNLNLRAMMAHHLENKYDMTIATRPYDMQVPFGVIDTDGQRITGITEKPKLNFLINAGVYCMSPSLLAHIPADTYFEITELVQKGIAVGGFEIRDFWMDVGRIDDFYNADETLKETTQ